MSALWSFKVLLSSKLKTPFYLFLFKRTARIEVRKVISRRGAPVDVLNKQRRRGDSDGCSNSNSLSSTKLIAKIIIKKIRTKIPLTKKSKFVKHLFTGSDNGEKTWTVQHFNNNKSSNSYRINKNKSINYLI